MKRTGPSSKALQETILLVKKTANKEHAPVWKRLAHELSRSTRERRAVNILKINKVSKEDETALVPGKVLSMGELTKPITVAAYSFSASAKQKINKKGKAVSIKDLLKMNPKGKKIRIVG